MTSTRLPGKIMKEVMGKPLLEYQVERMKRVKSADEIVIATTWGEADRVIVDYCDRLSIHYFRGSEQDVLSRYYEAAKASHADVVVRLTSDCPLIDPSIVERVLQYYFDHSAEYDYVSNCLIRTYPRGMDTEVFPIRVLEDGFREATDPQDREHVTSFFYQQDRRYRLSNVTLSRDCSRHRWTVDTEEDFILVKQILEILYPAKPNFSMEDVLDLIERDPRLFAINAHVEQKKLKFYSEDDLRGPRSHG
jgi:spore coat polysaccharide biosynthesis protein SpsF